MFGKDKLEENTETELMKEKNVPLDAPGVVTVQPGVAEINVIESAPGFDANEDKPGKEVPNEAPITHFLSPTNRRVNVATPALMARKDLFPCDENGKKVYDSRVF
jgi:hypothetical protein